MRMHGKILSLLTLTLSLCFINFSSSGSENQGIFAGQTISMDQVKAQEAIQIDLLKTDLLLNSDYTGSTVTETISTVLSSEGISQLQKASNDFWPKSQSLSLLEAYVIHPDGTKIVVSPDNVFTRPSAESQAAPGFTTSQTTTVVFPQLRVGSKTYVKWKLVQEKPSVIGFAQIFNPPFTTHVKDLQVAVQCPASLKLDWKKRGGFNVTDSTEKETRTIRATLKDVGPALPEISMENPIGFQPLFMISGISSWNELGAVYHKENIQSSAVTPQIQALSKEIVGSKKGKEAARAIYDWIAENIQYVAVYLNSQGAYISHTAEEVLKNGYGDCKDHVTLMHALLKAQQIDSDPVIVDWGMLYTPFPLPTPDQFDHVMIYLPEFDIFANPTDKFAPFGTLGLGLDGKFVVIATPEGRTAYLPTPLPQANSYENKAEIEFLENGLLKGTNTITSDGYVNDGIRKQFSTRIPVSKIAQALLDRTNYGGFGTFTLSGNPFDLSQLFGVKGDWTSSYSFSFDEKIYFWIPVGLDIMSPHSLRSLISPHKREYPFIATPGQFTWIYEIKVPKGYKVIHSLKNVSLQNDIGAYENLIQIKDGILTLTRVLTVKKALFTPEEYETLRSLLYALEHDVNGIFVLEKKAGA